MLDNFNNPIENLELLDSNRKKNYKTDKYGKVIVKVKKDEMNFYSYEKAGYISGNLNVSIDDNNKNFHIYKLPNEKGIYFIDKYDKKYVKLKEGDFKEVYFYPQFSWEGPTAFTYYYPSSNIQKISKNDENSILFYNISSDDFHILSIFDEGYFIKNTKFFLKEPISEAKIVKLNTNHIKDGFVIMNGLNPKTYVIVKKGEGIGNFSNAANKPFYYFKIM